MNRQWGQQTRRSKHKVRNAVGAAVALVHSRCVAASLRWQPGGLLLCNRRVMVVKGHPPSQPANWSRRWPRPVKAARQPSARRSGSTQCSSHRTCPPGAQWVRGDQGHHACGQSIFAAWTRSPVPRRTETHVSALGARWSRRELDWHASSSTRRSERVWEAARDARKQVGREGDRRPDQKLF